jgi:hypothetical protein
MVIGEKMVSDGTSTVVNSSLPFDML